MGMGQHAPDWPSRRPFLRGLAADEARAANGAYAVDAADISEVGSCKVESWLSAATNTDFSAVANPSCVVDTFKPVELSLLTNRARSDGDWSTTIAPKAKIELRSDRHRQVRLLVLCRRLVRRVDRRKPDRVRGRSRQPTGCPKPCGSTSMAAGCGTARVDRHYLLYGIGFDWKFTDTLQWTIEAFGQAGAVEIAERGPAAISDRRALPAQRDIFGRPDLRPQHHRRKRQLDHDRHHDPLSGARGRGKPDARALPAIYELRSQK